MDWEAKLARAIDEHAARTARGPAEGERPDLHLTAIGSASWAAGLAALMAGLPDVAVGWLRRAADEYVESWTAAPPGSWGRPIAALRCRLLAADTTGARLDAERTLAAGALEAGGPIAGYAAALALMALGRDDLAGPVVEGLRERSDFPADVADALAALVLGDAAGYAAAIGSVVRSFEERDAYLEDVAVADTALVLQALARARGLAVAISSPLLPV